MSSTAASHTGRFLAARLHDLPHAGPTRLAQLVRNTDDSRQRGFDALAAVVENALDDDVPALQLHGGGAREQRYIEFARQRVDVWAESDPLHDPGNPHCATDRNHQSTVHTTTRLLPESAIAKVSPARLKP